MEIVEIQQAERGRKYASVDRRPIDPPPVVLLKIFKVTDFGTESQLETEVEDYDTVISMGLFCTIDVISVDSPPATVEKSGDASSPDASQEITEAAPLSPLDVTTLPGNSTNLVVGEKSVPVYVIPYQGKKAMLFTFGDIAIQKEGTFYPIYRAFDITNQQDDIAPVTACCRGGEFQVFSTKDFPRLQGSTQLTRDLSDAGAPVHVRHENAHRRRSRTNSTRQREDT
ncbi:velvet factor [Flagelloscypha sp. PMI_526]|nr:velvet factor [Flagelloscypha sp. PMI_526]